MAELLGLVDLSQDTIDEIFEKAEHQTDWFFSLHRIIYPDWEEWPEGKRCDGFLQASETTCGYIHSRAIAFDKIHHPDVYAGGLWFNNGFSLDKNIPDWKVRPAPTIQPS